MLNKYMKKTEIIQEPKENKELLIKKLGFYDIEAEYSNTTILEERIVKVLPLYQPIHQDIIREVDESPPEGSIDDLYENEQIECKDSEFDSTRKPFGTMSMYKGPSANNRIDVKKIMDPNNDKPIKVQNESKSVSMSGMQGLKKFAQPELKTMFNPNKALEDLDDFTDSFFNQVPFSTFLAEQDAGKNKLGKSSPRGTPNRISSSMLDFEESNNQVCSKEFTPNNNEPIQKQAFDLDVSPFEGAYGQPFKSITGNFERNSPWISEEERKKQSEVLKHVTTVKEENTNVTLTAPSSSLGEGAARFHKIKTSQQKINEEETNKKIGNTNGTIERNDNQEELAPPTQDKLEVNNNNVLPATQEEMPMALYEEKFILKMGKILTESTLDVKPRKAIVLDIPEIKMGLIQVKPPYKIKVVIIPTEWPLEVSVEEYEKQQSGIHSSNNENNCKNIPTHQSKEEKDSVSVISKTSRMSLSSRRSSRRTTIRRPKSKTKKQKKVDDTSSKLSSGSRKKNQRNPSQPSIDGSKMNGSKYGDAASAVQSVATNNKKDGKNTLDKGAQNNEQVPDETDKVKLGDIIQTKPEFPWSGQEVLIDPDPYSAVWITNQLTNSRIWPYGWKGIIANLRWLARRFVGSDICENFMNLLVIINTVTLAMDRYQQPVSEANIMDTLNYVFTSIFTLELSLKLFGLGLVRYLGDSLNYLDLMVVIFSWVEIIFMGGAGAISAFRTLRVFRLVRTVRVIRVARLLRGLQSMMTLIDVIANTIGSFGYIGLMLLIIMLIYALFGMTLFAGKWNYPDGLPRPNFESFNNAFISVFQLLTVENWPTLLYAGMRNEFQPLVALFYISFLLIGNYILLNMFLAIMLDSFVEVSADQDDDEDEDVIFIKKNFRTAMFRVIQSLIFLLDRAG